MLGVDAALNGMPAMHDGPMQHIFQPLARSQQDLALTRSTSVTISVTGCSTWMRVFISMK